MVETIKKVTPWYISLILMILGVWIFFAVEKIVGAETIPSCGIGDRLLEWTTSINQYLHVHTKVANGILILCGILMDVSVLFLLVRTLYKNTFQPLLGLCFFFILRQLIQSLVSLPIPPGMISHYPGFPSLFSTFNATRDHYFSAFVGVSLIGALEAYRSKIRWLMALGFIIALFEAVMMIIMHIHYTTDIYTAIITAFTVSYISYRITPFLDQFFRKNIQIWLIFFIALGITLYFFTEHLIDIKTPPKCNIEDAIHQFVTPLNQYLHAHTKIADALLILSCNILDLAVLFIFACSLFGRGIRPLITIAIFITLREVLQLLVTLPIPPGIIFHYPGFPSLLTSYTLVNDLYFSAHTGVTLILAFEMQRFGKKWLTILGFSIFAFEIMAVLILEFHYTMDVYTAICTVICISFLASKISPSIDRVLGRL